MSCGSKFWKGVCGTCRRLSGATSFLPFSAIMTRRITSITWATASSACSSSHARLLSTSQNLPHGKANMT